MYTIEIPLFKTAGKNMLVWHENMQIASFRKTFRNIGHRTFECVHPHSIIDMKGENSDLHTVTLKEELFSNQKFARSWQGTSEQLGSFSILNEPWSFSDPLFYIHLPQQEAKVMVRKVPATPEIHFLYEGKCLQIVRIDSSSIIQKLTFTYNKKQKLLTPLEIAMFTYLLLFSS